MRCIVPALVLVLFLTGVATTAAVSGPPDSATLVESIRARYAAVHSYRIRGMVKMFAGTDSSTPPLIQFPLLSAGDRSGRLRLEIDNPFSGMTQVYNHGRYWIYVNRANRYACLEAVPLPGSSVMDFDLSRPMPWDAGIHNYAHIQWQAGMVTSLDTLERHGRRVPCYRLSWPVTADSTAKDTSRIQTYWVHPDDDRVLQERVENHAPSQPVTAIVTVNLEETLDAPLPDSLFTFTPPPGATAVDDPGQFFVGENRRGRPLPSLALPDLDGRIVRLADLKGRVVIVEFWATWCHPCQITMNNLTQLCDGIPPDSLVILAISNEDSTTLRQYQQHHPGPHHILRDEGAAYAGRCRVESLPTGFVLDRQGTIVAQYVGVQPEASLRRYLQQAGLTVPAGHSP